MALAEDAAEPLDGAQRRAQVVRDAVGEGLEFAVGLAQLPRTGRHARFQRAVEREHFALGAHALGDVLDLHQAGDVASGIAGDRRERELHLALLAIAAMQGPGAAHHPARLVDGLQLLAGADAVGGGIVQQVGQRQAHQLPRLPPHDARE